MPHGAGPDWNGNIVSWAPNAEVDIDDHNEKAVAWARGWVDAGAELVEDVARPKPSAPHKSEKADHQP